MKDAIDLQGYTPGHIGRAAVALFTLAAQKPLPDSYSVPWYMAPVLRALYRGSVPAGAFHMAWTPQGHELDTRRALVCFSGGKDSLAAALKLQATGHRVHLFNVPGINPSYGHERKHAQSLAAFLGLPLVEQGVKLAPQAYTENPAKNTTILALAADWGIPRGFGTYAMGTLSRDTGATTPFESGWSDALEMTQAGADMLAAYAPGACLDPYLLRSETDSLLTILAHQQAPALLNRVSSCMLPARYKPSTRRANERKFGPLLPGRCGSCYKCAQEILVLEAAGWRICGDAQRAHCVDMLRKAAPMFHGPAAKHWSAGKIVEEYVDLELLNGGQKPAPTGEK